jgi:hypothetical protein
MKTIFIAIVVLFTVSLVSAYDVLQYSDTFIDQSRNNREILTEIYYPSGDNYEHTFPSLIFGHGWLLPYSNYQALAEELASNGYIVAFPRTEGGLFPDHQEFALDISFIGMAIQLEGDDESSNLYGIVDQTSVAMGHSMGGGCSVLASSGNDFFAGLITFAAAETNPSAIEAAVSVTCPSLTFSADDDWITPPEDHQIPIYENLGSERKYYINILNEDHMGITSNGNIPDIIIPFIQYLSSGEHGYLVEFESTLDSLADSNVLEYESDNSTYAESEIETPSNFHITSYPNPVNSMAVIKYELPYQSHVSISIFDILGRKLNTLEDRIESAGHHSVIWNTDHLPSGIYFYTIQTDFTAQTKKITLLK